MGTLIQTNVRPCGGSPRIRYTHPSPTPAGRFLRWWTSESTPRCLPTAHRLWLSRVTFWPSWGWRRIQGTTTVLCFYPIHSVRKKLMGEGDQIPAVLEINFILIMAVSLGLSVDMHDLYASSGNRDLSLLS